MAKELFIRKIDAQSVEPENIPALFAAKAVEYTPIDTVNWPEEFPGKPDVKFAIAHNSDNILLHYKVTEDCVRAVGANDRDNVWEDSCVEFFCAPGEEGDDRYYNFETNCIGSLLSCIGPDRNSREFIPWECYRSVKRWASLGREPFELKSEKTSWELALVIPASVMYAHGIKSLDGAKFRGNFYKCGDNLPVVSFLSWAPISTPGPDFHCPRFFGKLNFE